MAKDNKSNIGLRNVSNLLPKKVELKTTEIDVKTTDKVVQKIHSTQGKQTRLSVDVPEELYQPIKIRQLTKGYKTTREYILDLINKDLEEGNK
ncbi:MAG: hypothetical protein ACOVQ4_18575 [Flectobacillus sp.]|jgi:hypothetical protein|uniref:hypothetical protein n=1 Tax=Flectobacillus sp. TaxID=50419 RepID=UPI003B9D0919